MNFYTDILCNLTDSSIILTPNRRLTLHLHSQYQQLQHARGLSCWNTPAILPVNTWIETLWSDYTAATFNDLPLILNAAQEQQLWESILTSSDYVQLCLQVSETARLVKSARGLLKQWQLTPDNPLFDGAEDYLALRHWIQTFDVKLEENNWIDQASIPDILRECVNSEIFTIPTCIYLAGFTELSPQLSALLSALKSKGSDVTTITPENKSHSIMRTSALNDDEEIRLCASWAKDQHDSNPDAVIGCVFPALETQRDRILQIFSEIFGSRSEFNLSAGKPLSHYPVIHAALELLSLYKKQISCESFYYILATPFISGGESERIKRAQFDTRLRAKNFNNIDLISLLADSADEKTLQLKRSCPRLAQSINAFKALLEDQQVTASCTHWSYIFNQALTLLGWPGERILNSEEYQVVEEWLKLLHEMSSLDLTTEPLNYYQALQVLTALAAAKPFQPKSPAANVQILGVLEAAGLCFDNLWISGMDDMRWPSQPKPNPFIPKQLQRELNMPHASAERELTYCQAITHQFECSADNVIFSYARTHEDNHAQPSPLISGLPEAFMFTLYPAASQRIYDSRIIESLNDDVAPPLFNDEQPSGGVKIIENQALCPFKAFAESRLFARELESTQPGLRPKERGIIVHQILERCWNHLRTSDNLQTMSPEQLHVSLEQWIDEALQQYAHPQRHQQSYLSLEKQRLHQLIFDWLQIEMKRSPFAVIASESSSEITFGKLTINVRIDRIDQLADGNKLIIDYKTSSDLNINKWFGSRPESPQLPLYTQIDKEHTAGISFAQIAPGKFGFKGVSQYDLNIEGITPSDKIKGDNKCSWRELTDVWQTTLHALADDFYDGKAHVDPKDTKKTCVYCGLKPLCRIYEYNGYLQDE
ncbi:MAG TPA: PD-(D/E)XK nuclease family protein [Gammaproteobacteria bacterium]|jgi:probable DNA repair protein|nr:PD-(D/E)XK nuclease family protein [Gammaproteobacteria bacterium]